MTLSGRGSGATERLSPDPKRFSHTPPRRRPKLEVSLGAKKVSATATCLALLCVLLLRQYTVGRGGTPRTISLRGDHHRCSVPATGDVGDSHITIEGAGVGEGRGKKEKEEGSGVPRILTVLTTYSKRSELVKAYKDQVWGSREDRDRPPLFVVSDSDDPDLHEVVDFRIGSSRGHRLLAAVAEACMRYEGTFDWLAIGDDDTVFMYNRAKEFLRHINHTQPVAFGRIDGLDPTSSPCKNRACFSPEAKQNASDVLAARGCCQDFTRPCQVPAYPEEHETKRAYKYEDYGPSGLFWPYGGMGTFVSAGLAVKAVGGERGWGDCASMFGRMNTDVQFAQCMKMHGYSMGSYPEGFAQMETSDPDQIQDSLVNNCQVMGVHLGIKHLADGSNYTADSFGDAVAAVRDVDLGWTTEEGAETARLDTLCHESWAALSRWG